MANPCPSFDQLAARCVDLAEDAAIPWTGAGFRFTGLKHARSRDLLSGQGAKASGGRINAAGTFPVIYTSTDPATASAETFRSFADFGFDKAVVRPRVFVGIGFRLAKVPDLSDRRIRRRIKVNLEDLARPWLAEQEAGREALTQTIGRAAYGAGFEGVILPSTRRKGGLDLDVFPEKLGAGSIVTVLAEEDLRKYLR